MKVLLIGSGGREHAIALKLMENPRIKKLFCAPGNGGMSSIATCVDINACDISSMTLFAKQNNIDFVVVAPDNPLVLGMADAFEKLGIPAFGPRKSAAIIEGSKVFAKSFMKKYGIPTADYMVFDDQNNAVEYILKKGAPLVIKADGLALGKGVVVAKNKDDAITAVKDMMSGGKFGDAGARVVIEECLEGPEVSVLCFTDGKTIRPMVSAEDHKRAFDGDTGPNTGGMGAFAPSTVYTEDIEKKCIKEIFIPTVQGMAAEERPFKGVLYFGLMITEQGPKVIEYNARFGDPETQVVLPLLKTDLLDIMQAVESERLHEIDIKWDNFAALCVVMASKGYPGEYQTGKVIHGLAAAAEKGAVIYHAGTKIADGKFITSGGRVLAVSVTALDLHTARKKAYAALSDIHFDGAFYRKDIGKRIPKGL